MIFTGERRLAAVFAAAVAELPIDWVLVSDGDLAERFVEDEAFQFIVVDTTAEGGPALIRTARKSARNHTCFIFALAEPTAGESLLQLGADTYLSNPGGLCSLANQIIGDLPLMNHQRRWGRRCRLNVPVSITYPGGAVSANALSLSQGGMMVQVKSELPSDDVLSIELALPGATCMKLYGITTWSRLDFLVGIRFVGLNDEQRKTLADWVSVQTDEACS